MLAIALAFGTTLGLRALAAAPDTTPAPRPASTAVLEAVPADLATATDQAIDEVRTLRREVGSISRAAAKAGDKIKSGCVDEQLATLRRLVLDAEMLKNDILDAIKKDDAEAKSSLWSQLAEIRRGANTARNDAGVCIGEETVFVTMLGAPIDDPTQGEVNPFNVPSADFEQVNVASPWY